MSVSPGAGVVDPRLASSELSDFGFSVLTIVELAVAVLPELSLIVGVVEISF